MKKNVQVTSKLQIEMLKPEKCMQITLWGCSTLIINSGAKQKIP